MVDGVDDRSNHTVCREVSVPPQYARVRADDTSSTCSNRVSGTSVGAKTIISARVASSVTIVRAESEDGFPNGPFSSASVMRPATWTSSLRLPWYDSPSSPMRNATSPEMRSRSYSPQGSWNSSEHQLHTSTRLL